MKSILRFALSSFLLGLAPFILQAERSGPEKDPKFAVLVHEAQAFAANKKPKEAVKKCDQVIRAYKRHFSNSEERIYCARTSTETLAYLLMAASVEKQSAKAISSIWADAHYVKAYALLEMGRNAEAKKDLRRAVELSPLNSSYLSELGHVLQIEKDWSGAMEVFKSAEEHAGFSPEDAGARELGRARRGLGYCLVELGKLEEAEEVYLRCLATDPDDNRAKAELAYVRHLRTTGN